MDAFVAQVGDEHPMIAVHIDHRELLARRVEEAEPGDRQQRIGVMQIAAGSRELPSLAMYLHVELELAIAEAALGQQAQASARLERLLQRHATAGTLTLSALHETRLRVALHDRDFAACQLHLEELRRCVLPTGVACLVELARTLAEFAGRHLRRDKLAEQASRLL